MKIKILKPLKKYLVNTIVNVELNKYWRRRLKDSEIDNCIEIVSENVKQNIEKENKQKEKKQKN